MVVGAGPLNFFMNRMLFVESSSAERVEDVNVVEDNAPVLPVKLSKSFLKKERDQEEERKKAATSATDLPRLVRTYFHEIAPPLLRGDSFASESDSAFLSEDVRSQTSVASSREADAPSSSIPTRSPSPPTSREEEIPPLKDEPPPQEPPPLPVRKKKTTKTEKPVTPQTEKRLDLKKRFPKNRKRIGSKGKKK